jgi:aerobic C4-dicarboxylate transport protein
MLRSNEVTHQAKPAKRPLYHQIYFQVIVAIVIGVVLGQFAPNFAIKLEPLGNAFIKLIKMIIAPVIFLTITVGIARMNHIGGVGRVMFKAMAYFLTLSTGALVIGLIVALVIQPGKGMNINPADLKTSDVETVEDYVKKSHDLSVSGFLMDIIPETVVGAFTSGNVLQVLLIAVLFGISLILAGEHSEPITGFLESLSLPVFKMVSLVMKFAPIGALGAMAFVVGKFGLWSLVKLASLVATFYISSLLFVTLILGTVAWLHGFSIFKLMYYLREELFLILGTSSSEAALPGLINKMEKAGCEKAVVGLVVPTGYSFNLDGTNIYMTLAALFLAQAMNVDLSAGEITILLLVAIVSSKGAAGITGAGFAALAATLSVVPSIPVVGMALILGIDKFMSECRALTNFIGNAVATIVVARWEGALDTEQLSRTLNRGSPPDLLAPNLELHE